MTKSRGMRAYQLSTRLNHNEYVGVTYSAYRQQPLLPQRSTNTGVQTCKPNCQLRALENGLGWLAPFLGCGQKYLAVAYRTVIWPLEKQVRVRCVPLLHGLHRRTAFER